MPFFVWRVNIVEITPSLVGFRTAVVVCSLRCQFPFFFSSSSPLLLETETEKKKCKSTEGQKRGFLLTNFYIYIYNLCHVVRHFALRLLLYDKREANIDAVSCHYIQFIFTCKWRNYFGLPSPSPPPPPPPTPSTSFPLLYDTD